MFNYNFTIHYFMRTIITSDDEAISTVKGIAIICAVLVVAISIFILQGGIYHLNTSSNVPVKANAYTTMNSICCAYDYNTTVSIDITNFTLKSVNNSAIYASLVVINASGAYVFHGNLGKGSLSPYPSSIFTASKNFSVNSRYTLQFYDKQAPSHIYLNISYSGSIIYSSGQITQSSCSSPSNMAIGGSFNLNSTGNSTSGYNTSIYMNITTFSVGSVSNSRIGIQFSVTNSTGKYNYEGYLNGTIKSTSANASIASLFSYSKNLQAGAFYVIHLSGKTQITLASVSFIFCDGPLLQINIS